MRERAAVELQPGERLRSIGGNFFHEPGAVHRLAMGEDHRDEGDADAAAELAGEIIETGAGGDLVARQVAERGEAQGRNMQTLPIARSISGQNKE